MTDTRIIIVQVDQNYFTLVEHTGLRNRRVFSHSPAFSCPSDKNHYSLLPCVSIFCKGKQHFIASNHLELLKISLKRQNSRPMPALNYRYSPQHTQA